MFKHAWKKLDLWAKFVGTGGPVDVAGLPELLTRVHNGVGRVTVDQISNPGNPEVKLNDRAAPLAKFSAQNGGPIAQPVIHTSGTVPPQTVSQFGPVTVAMQKPGGGGPVDPFPGLTKVRDRR
jgi:hypothetical protein